MVKKKVLAMFGCLIIDNSSTNHIKITFGQCYNGRQSYNNYIDGAVFGSNYNFSSSSYKKP